MVTHKETENIHAANPKMESVLQTKSNSLERASLK